MARIFGPEALVMENVPNITRARTADGRLVTDVIRKEFERLGYNVYSAILRASSCGVPQKRERFFCIASRKELITPFPSPTHLSKSTQMSVFDAPASLAQCPTLWDAISDLPVIEACEGSEVMDYSAAPQNKYQQWCRAGSPVMSVSFGLSGEDIKLQG